MILAAHQPQFLPWLGYFDKMRRCDVFVLLDDVQFKKNEWQNRNRIWSREGGQWLTVPVLHHFPENINEVRINNAVVWRQKHQKSLRQTYSHSKHFEDCWGPWEKMYAQEWKTLLAINLYTIEHIMKVLKISTRMEYSSQLNVEGHSTERLVNLCKKVGARTYLAGAGGRDYMDLKLFDKAGIQVIFQEYRHPVYQQFGGAFIPNLSAVDFIFYCGSEIAGEKW